MDRGTQHSDMFLLKAEEGREGNVRCAADRPRGWSMCRCGKRAEGRGAGGALHEQPPCPLWGVEDALS